jgi:uncharacterized membrane protein YdbT with pleckstrin-like domain
MLFRNVARPAYPCEVKLGAVTIPNTTLQSEFLVLNFYSMSRSYISLAKVAIFSFGIDNYLVLYQYVGQSCQHGSIIRLSRGLTGRPAFSICRFQR